MEMKILKREHIFNAAELVSKELGTRFVFLKDESKRNTVCFTNSKDDDIIYSISFKIPNNKQEIICDKEKIKEYDSLKDNEVDFLISGCLRIELNELKFHKRGNDKYKQKIDIYALKRSGKPIGVGFDVEPVILRGSYNLHTGWGQTVPSEESIKDILFSNDVLKELIINKNEKPINEVIEKTICETMKGIVISLENEIDSIKKLSVQKEISDILVSDFESLGFKIKSNKQIKEHISYMYDVEMNDASHYEMIMNLFDLKEYGKFLITMNFYFDLSNIILSLDSNDRTKININQERETIIFNMHNPHFKPEDIVKKVKEFIEKVTKTIRERIGFITCQIKEIESSLTERGQNVNK